MSVQKQRFFYLKLYIILNPKKKAVRNMDSPAIRFSGVQPVSS